MTLPVKWEVRRLSWWRAAAYAALDLNARATDFCAAALSRLARRWWLVAAIAAIIFGSSLYAVTGGRQISLQGTFLQSGPGATLRTIESKLRDTVACADFSGADIGAQITAAIAALPATGGVVDCRSLSGAQALSSTLTLSKGNTTILLGNYNIVMGSNQVVVPVGTHMVALIGSVPYGSPGTGIQGGTQFTYTGTTVAIKVGAASAGTDNFLMQDVGIDTSLGGTGLAAIGLQLNRVRNYNLIRPRFNCYAGGGNTQKCVDLEGSGDYTGGYMESPWFSNGNTGIYFGAAANANTIVGAILGGQNVGTALDFAGTVAEPIAGNAVIGGDAENWATVAHFDYARDNQIFGMRTEADTNLANATANSSRNYMMTNGVSFPYVDLGVYNGISTTLSPVLSQTKIQIHNKQDTASNFWIGAGSASDQARNICFLDKSENLQWCMLADSSGVFNIQNGVTSKFREILGSANSFYSTEGGGGFLFNATSNSGTGGGLFESGGASPAVVFRWTSTGISTDDKGYKAQRSATGCATAAAAGSTCDTTVTWTTAFADANYTPTCDGLGVTSGVPVHGGVVSKVAASLVFRTVAMTAAAAQYTNISCNVPHD